MTDEQKAAEAPTDYSAHFAAIEAAQVVCATANADMMRIDGEMRRCARAEAIASAEDAGVKLGSTLLTLKGRWEYQNKPVLILRVTCWSAPSQTPKFPRWQLQAHYAFARKDGQPNKGRNQEYENIVCEHPSGFGAALLARLPLWVKP